MQTATQDPAIRPTQWRTRLLPHITALVVYTLLALVGTYPLVLHLDSHLPAVTSEQGHDVWQNAWNFWWIHQALVVEQTNPYWTDAVFYPQGASLALHTLNLPLGLLALPVLPLFGIITTYNIMTLFMLILAGYSSFLLARHIVSSNPAALVAGAIVLCSPLRFAELRYAQLPTLSDYGLPLAILALLLALERRTWWSLSLVAGAVLLTGLSSWYHLFHLGIVFAVLLIWRGLVAWRAGGGRAFWGELQPWLWVSVFSGLLLLPFVVPVVLEATGSTLARKDDGLVALADLARLLPGSFGTIWQTVPLNWQSTHSFAFVPLLLALGGLLLKPRVTAIWAIIGLVCLVLSLGPSLWINETNTGFPLPYALLRSLPVLEVLRAPLRLNAVTTLMLALLAAFGLAALQTRYLQTVRAGWLAALLLVGLITIDGLRLPLTLRDGQVSPWYHEIAAEPGDWSLLELPFGRADRALKEMYAQTHHGKTILLGHLSRDVPRFPYEGIPQMQALDTGELYPDVLPLSDAEWEQLLRGSRAHYLVLHREDNTPARINAQAEAAHTLLAPLSPVYSDSQIEVYRLDALATWLDDAGQERANTPAVPPFLGFREPWPRLELGDEGWSRWLPPEPAGLWAYTPAPQRVALEVTLYSYPPGERPLEIWLNGTQLQTLTIPQGLPLRRYYSRPFTLPAGPSELELYAPEGGLSPLEQGSGTDSRALSFSIHGVRLVLLDE